MTIMKKLNLVIIMVFIVTILSCISISFATRCGDNNAQGNEECDGTDLRGYFCGVIDVFDKSNIYNYDPYTNHRDSYGNLPGDYYAGLLGTLSCGSNCKFVSTCHNSVCGDGELEDVEECDNGADNSDVEPNSCRTNCKLFSCSDAVVDSGEQCDLGIMNSDEIPNRCRQNCKTPICGDGVIDTNLGEECDVGNPLANNGCYKCKQCFAATDNLHITRNAKLCEETYNVVDSAEEGILIIDGNNIKLDCNGAIIAGPQGTYAGSQNNQSTKNNVKGSQNTASASDTAAQVEMNYVGTGIYIKGNNNVLTNCDIRKFQYGVKVEYAGNVIANNKLCSNNFGISSSSSNNFGIKNTCKESINWRENGVTRCTYTCTNQLNSDTTCPACECISYESEDDNTNSSEESDSVFGSIGKFFKNIFKADASSNVGKELQNSANNDDKTKIEDDSKSNEQLKTNSSANSKTTITSNTVQQKNTTANIAPQKNATVNTIQPKVTVTNTTSQKAPVASVNSSVGIKSVNVTATTTQITKPAVTTTQNTTQVTAKTNVVAPVDSTVAKTAVVGSTNIATVQTNTTLPKTTTATAGIISNTTIKQPIPVVPSKTIIR